MNTYEVEVTFTVKADTSDEAWKMIDAVLESDAVFQHGNGIDGYEILNGAVTLMEDEA